MGLQMSNVELADALDMRRGVEESASERTRLLFAGIIV